jgi:hypothetical protein
MSDGTTIKGRGFGRQPTSLRFISLKMFQFVELGENQNKLINLRGKIT